MDATFGTNNAGMDLFAVLAEVDGTGVILAYCFVGAATSSEGNGRSDAGAMTSILEQFLRRIREAGFLPTFFGFDKDRSQIAAVKTVWPDAKTSALLLACEPCDPGKAQGLVLHQNLGQV